MRGDDPMAVSYKKLWKLLIDKDMKKQDLRVAAKISSSSVAKLSKGENVNTDILVKICKAWSAMCLTSWRLRQRMGAGTEHQTKYCKSRESSVCSILETPTGVSGSQLRPLTALYL